MKNFDLHRFGQALKCQLMVGRKLWIRLFSIFTLVMFMAGLFWTRIQGTPYKIMETWGADELYQAYERHVTQSVVFAVVFFCIAMLFGAEPAVRRVRYQLFLNRKPYHFAGYLPSRQAPLVSGRLRQYGNRRWSHT